MSTICPVMPEQIGSNVDYTANESDIILSLTVLEYYQENRNQLRRPSIGYFPEKLMDVLAQR